LSDNGSLDLSTAFILPVNHSCLAIAGASLLTSISFNLVNVLYQLNLATELAHFGSSA
jgi:hypothetical protein